MPWDPEQYARFKAERSAPFYDLLTLVQLRPNLQVIDLGCGSGELTRVLADHLPASETLGIDSSPEMLEKSATFARPGLRFELGQIETIEGQWDLVFSNAAVQWIENHTRLIPRLLELLVPAGQLVIQMPSNHNHITHRLIHEVAGQEPFRSILNGWQRNSPVLPVDEYAALLYQSGAKEILVFEKVYAHVLPDALALAEWTSGTALVPYFERLGAEWREPFMQQYRQRLSEIYPPGPVFYPFRRILFSAVRG